MEKELTIDAVRENFDAVCEFILSCCASASPKAKRQIAIAADEIFTNVASYAYNPMVGKIVVRVFEEDKDITIEFEDGGVPYNPLETAEPNLSSDLNERVEGGLGIFLVKRLMDNVTYRRDGNKNILAISKGI